MDAKAFDAAFPVKAPEAKPKPPSSAFNEFTGKVAPFMAIPGGPIAQTVGSGILGAAQAGMEGKNPLSGGGLAAGGAALGHGIGAVGGPILSKLSSMVPPVKQAMQGLEASRLGQRVGQILPELGTKGKELFEFVRQGAGMQVRKGMLSDMSKQVEQMLGPNSIRVPSLGLARASLKEAMGELEKIGEKAYPGGGIKQLPLADRQAVKAARHDYGQARQEIVTSLNQMAPGAGDMFDKAYSRASAQGAYLELLDKAFDSSGRLDRSKLMAALNKAPERWRIQFGPYWKEFVGALTGGQNLPAQASKGIVPDVVSRGLSAVGAGFPEASLGGATLATQAAVNHLPGMSHGR